MKTKTRIGLVASLPAPMVKLLAALLAAAAALLPAAARADGAVEAWVQRWSAPVGSSDYAYKVVNDSAGNVIVAGETSDGISGGVDMLIIEYSSAGMPLWTNRYNGPGNSDDEVRGVAVDASGNVYVTGSSYDSNGDSDYATIAYSSAGVPLWTNRYSGPGDSGDNAQAVAVDASGNVYVTGSSYGSNGGSDYATIAYSSAGVPLWTNRYNGPGNSNDGAQALAVDVGGNVLVTGYSYGDSSGGDYATIKYSSAGVPLWTNRYNGPGNDSDWAQAVAVDGSGNVYVTGYSAGGGYYDYATIGYSSTGVPLWTNRYNGPGETDDEALAVAVDGSGNVYVTGFSDGGGYNYDYATIKYSSAGVPLWTNRYDGPGNDDDEALAVAMDGSGNVYVTGYSTGSGDDYATIAYSSAGVPLWTNRYNGPGSGSDYAQALAVSGGGTVYVTGSSYDSTSGPDYLTLAYSSAGMALWTNRFNRGPGNSNDRAIAVAVDGSGNVYVAGSSDFGADTDDYLTVAYSSAGLPLWTNRYNGPGNGDDSAHAVVVDTNGNVFVTGYSYGSGSGADYATIKYSSAGAPLWTNRYNGPGNSSDGAEAVAVDASGNVFVTGYSPGGSSGGDYATIKYSSAGAPLWTNRYNGPGNAGDHAQALAVDTNGNVVVTGVTDVGDYYYRYATIKYSSAGMQLWTNVDQAGNNHACAQAVAVDASGNVFVTGYSRYSSYENGEDYATIAYSSAGVKLWINRYNGPGNSQDRPQAVAVDASGNVYVTGYSYGGSSGSDYATIKYSGAGVPLWTNRYNGPGDSEDHACAVAVDASGNVYVTGQSVGSGSYYDYATIAYSSAGVPLWTNRYNGPANGNDYSQTKSCLAIGPDGEVCVTGSSDGNYGDGATYDFATVKFVTAPLIITQPLSRTNFAGTTATFSVTAVGADQLHCQWRMQGTNLVEGGNLSGVTTTNLVIGNVQPGDAGDYTVVVTNDYSSVTSQVARLTVEVVVPETLQAQVLAADRLRVVIQGSAGRVFSLQGSPDLFHWARLSTHTNQNGTLALTNSRPAGRKAYFYRTVFFPPDHPPGVSAPTLSGALWLPEGRMRFDLHADAGTAWRVEGSPDLVHWGNYGVLTNEIGVLAITNASFGQPGAYFYRVAQP